MSRTSTTRARSRARCSSRGHLESQAETKLSDREQPVVVFCAGGNRSAFAAETLQQLGFTTSCRWPAASAAGRTKGRPWITPAALSPEQRNRYGRHILLPEVGEEGQQKLLESKVLLLGAGGLGSPAALYLAAAGVGTLGIVDMDVVDASNLQRQILHNMERIGERKVDSAKKTLTAAQPRRRRRHLRRAPRRRQRARHHRRLRRDRRRHRQLPDALPPQRRVAARSASRSCTDRSSASRVR